MLSFKVPEDIEKKLREEAKDREMSVSALIRGIIKEYYKKKES